MTDTRANSSITLYPAAAPLRGEIRVPGDKSISHRAVMLGALAEGSTEIHGFLSGADCLSTMACFRKLGVEISADGSPLIIRGRGLHGLRAPAGDLDCGNSGTTARLLAGILAGQPFSSRLIGDASLSARPMGRIADPLRRMGAKIGDGSFEPSPTLPLVISPSHLTGIRYESPVASAQVKSCVLFAGLYAEGDTTLVEPVRSRDHTERMLRAFGAEVNVGALRGSKESSPCAVRISPEPHLAGQTIHIPGDISSAAAFLCAAAIVPDSEIFLPNVGVNPTRDGVLHILEHMGVSVERHNLCEMCGEPVADLLVRGPSSLTPVTIEGEIIPTLIDELPLLSVVCAFADGESVIRDASELRVKESDRIRVICEGLTRMGADVSETDDGLVICGGRPLHGASIETAGDHRIAMAFSVAALGAEGPTEIEDASCVQISYPGFFDEWGRFFIP